MLALSNWEFIIFEFIGGLGLFLFSIRYLGDGLQRAYGKQLQLAMHRFTVHPLVGVLSGLVVTVLIQSSTATSILVVGLVNAGYLTLRQAVSVLMGANIGTTLTAFFIGIDLIKFGLPIMAVGAFLIYFFVNQRTQQIGKVLFGAGGIFYGLTLIGEGLHPVLDMEAFQSLAASMHSNPITGVAIGTFTTIVVQSSGATVAILQELYAQNGIDLKGAMPVLLGDNLGTTLTAMLAAIGATVQAKRAALSHVMFNAIGMVAFLLILPLFVDIVAWMQQAFELNDKLTIASAHGFYNVASTVLLLPLLGSFVWLITKIIPGEEEKPMALNNHLDPLFIQQSPVLALEQAKLEVLHMGRLAVDGLEQASTYANNHERQFADLAMQLEKEVNRKDREITDYLSKISTNTLSEEESIMHAALLDAIRDIERIGDHFENVVEFVDFQISSNIKLTREAQQELNSMFDLTIMTVKQALEALDKQDRETALAVLQKEDKIDKMERAYRKSHLIRLNEGKCAGSAGIVFVDIISNLERIGDHSVNIAQLILGE
ncbi:sodium-dependent phosphate transporter [Virgibacillus sp. 7505]|uniref:Na/Pi cotransporter family protein n=1 Tax=Virgibacillus sp. 7505 TaxID=2022548 RepID=UPI000BA7B382|nr:Na/Pi cotransporter family protein [Virgibacillus sp. 7505]PAE17178.1 sodium-dependent phosphate transporter [Virgibacillus sp. 7505]